MLRQQLLESGGKKLLLSAEEAAGEDTERAFENAVDKTLEQMRKVPPLASLPLLIMPPPPPPLPQNFYVDMKNATDAAGSDKFVLMVRRAIKNRPQNSHPYPGNSRAAGIRQGVCSASCVPVLVPQTNQHRVTPCKPKLLHSVLRNMDITEINDDEIISLIGYDRAQLAGKSGEDKQEAMLVMREEDDDMVTQFRRLQVMPAAVTHTHSLSTMQSSAPPSPAGGRVAWLDSIPRSLIALCCSG